jgi:hypothetical protein
VGSVGADKQARDLVVDDEKRKGHLQDVAEQQVACVFL